MFITFLENEERDKLKFIAERAMLNTVSEYIFRFLAQLKQYKNANEMDVVETYHQHVKCKCPLMY